MILCSLDQLSRTGLHAVLNIYVENIIPMEMTDFQNWKNNFSKFLISIDFELENIQSAALYVCSFNPANNFPNTRITLLLCGEFTSNYIRALVTVASK